MNKQIKLISLCFLLLCIGCTKKNQSPPAPPPIPVKTAMSESKTIPFFIDSIGHFTAYNTVTIQAQVQGELTGLYFNEGQKVQKGDLLFTIDVLPYQAVLDKAVATLRQNEALYAYNKSRVDRYSQLVGDDFVSVLDYEQYVADMKTYEALINESLADIESAEINVGYCTLYSPIEGITGKRLIDVGNIITDVGSKLLVINQITPIFVDFSIPERFFDKVYQKQQESPLNVEVFVPNTPLKAVATLQMLDNTVNPNTGMIDLRAILANKEAHYWPEQFIRIRLIVDMIENAVMVPPSAVLPSSRGEIVWVINSNNEAEPISVVTGEQYENQIQIISGLEPGMQVVTFGQLSLTKGCKVTVRNNDGSKAS